MLQLVLTFVQLNFNRFYLVSFNVLDDECHPLILFFLELYRNLVEKVKYKNAYYWQCRCGWSIAKPAELKAKEAEQNETDTTDKDSVDKR